MAPRPLRVALAAGVGFLSGATLTGATRVIARDLADAGADEAQGFPLLRVWTAAAAPGWHGAVPPPAGLGAPALGPAAVGDVRTPRRGRVSRNMLENPDRRVEGGVNQDKTEEKESDGPDDAGVALINEYAEKEFGGVLRCSWTPTKGRILRATRSFALGDEIFAERPPLHVVQEQERSPAFRRLQELCREHKDALDYEPLHYWCAIQSLTKEQLKDALAGSTGATRDIHEKLLLLHHDRGLREPSRAAEIVAKELAPCADVLTVERLLQVWALNGFQFTQEPPGAATYFFSSFMSHSCSPNAMWSYSGPRQVLRARREILAGDEVCISYLEDSFLMQAAPERRFELQSSWGFWCNCERCKPGGRDLSRGVRCPECGRGKIFAKTPEAGPAKDASWLPSHWAGACCDECGHTVLDDQGVKLAEYESKAQQLLSKSSGVAARDAKEFEGDEAFVDQHFAQHVLADLVREQIGLAYWEDDRLADVRRLLERRVEFQRAAYPGVNTAKAEVLEALADYIGDPRFGPATGRDLDVARRCYTEALEIRRLMFGDDNVLCRRIARKLAQLE